MWDAAKQCAWRAHVLLTCPRKEERFKINDFSFHFQKLKEEEEINPQVSRRKEITMKKNNEIENGQEVEEINKTKSWF